MFHIVTEKQKASVKRLSNSMSRWQDSNLRYMQTGLGRKNWRGGFSEYYSGNNLCFGIIKPIESAGNK